MNLKDEIYLAIRGIDRHRDIWLDPEDMFGIAADIFAIPAIKRLLYNEWLCDCCGAWVNEGNACPHGTTEDMYDEVGRKMLLRR